MQEDADRGWSAPLVVRGRWVVRRENREPISGIRSGRSSSVDSPRGDAITPARGAAIDWVVENRNHDPLNPIKVISLSYGTGGNPTVWNDPLSLAVQQAWKAGIVFSGASLAPPRWANGIGPGWSRMA